MAKKKKCLFNLFNGWINPGMVTFGLRDVTVTEPKRIRWGQTTVTFTAYLLTDREWQSITSQGTAPGETVGASIVCDKVAGSPDILKYCRQEYRAGRLIKQKSRVRIF